MEELTRFVWGALGILTLAIALVFGSAITLQGWHDVRQAQPPASGVLDSRPVGGTGAAASSYWYGRLESAISGDRRS